MMIHSDRHEKYPKREENKREWCALWNEINTSKNGSWLYYKNEKSKEIKVWYRRDNNNKNKNKKPTKQATAAATAEGWWRIWCC